MRQHLIEGTTPFITDSDAKISKEMAVFFNPMMKLNRDTTLVALLATGAPSEALRVALPMEASGLRAARILNELVRPKLFVPKAVAVNDLSPAAIAYAKENIALNSEGIAVDDAARFVLSSLDANIFLRQRHFDYIDVDPFGTPNPFLDAAVQSIKRGGILGVTATDTAALAGTYPAATARKYWSVPSRTWLMHEVGMRILVRKVQLVAAQHEKALVPLLSLSTDHYYRVLFRCEQSVAGVRGVLRNHRYLVVCPACMQTGVSDENTGACAACGKRADVAGPLWAGPLHDKAFIAAMLVAAEKLDAISKDVAPFKELHALLVIILDECRVGTVGFYDVHEIASRYKVPVPRREALLARLGEHGCRTHISGHGVKTDLPVAEIAALLKKMQDEKMESS
jgi:tRNA (guanine26-N2/guanine27-N2)-dimethyltransferase